MSGSNFFPQLIRVLNHQIFTLMYSVAKNNSETRSQHYVQQAYQEGFYDDGKTDYWILDKNLLVKPDGQIESNAPKNRGKRVCFEERYFYESSFYKEKDFLEKNFFEPLDRDGIVAIKWMSSEDKHLLPTESIGVTLLIYISAQKFRTPKGLELIYQTNPGMTREVLLETLQEIHQNMAITLGESVIEILDASLCTTKFLVSDAPVIEWNPYAPHVDIDLYLLKGTRVIFPVNKNACVVFTPRELVESELSKKDYTQLRINARKYGDLRLDIRKFENLKLIENSEVEAVNKLIKERALRYVAGGKKEYLSIPADVPELESIFRPKIFKRSGGIAQEINGEVVGVDPYGRPMEGEELESMRKFFKRVKEKKL
jgi:hypothetical protein